MSAHRLTIARGQRWLSLRGPLVRMGFLVAVTFEAALALHRCLMISVARRQQVSVSSPVFPFKRWLYGGGQAQGEGERENQTNGLLKKCKDKLS